MDLRDQLDHLVSKEIRDLEELWGRRELLVSMVRRVQLDRGDLRVQLDKKAHWVTRGTLGTLDREGQRELKVTEATKDHREQREHQGDRDTGVHQGTEEESVFQGSRVNQVPEAHQASLDGSDQGATLGRQEPKARRGSLDTLALLAG
ncbi:uncharacterized protein AB9X84_016086 [Acanthopagrus schlegelii]